MYDDDNATTNNETYVILPQNSYIFGSVNLFFFSFLHNSTKILKKKKLELHENPTMDF